MADANYAVKRNSNQEPLWRGKRPLLPRLDIELTERCNNACMHCYINLPSHDSRASARELSTDQWMGILQQAAELGALYIRFTGGEPLLRPDFVDLYLFARRLGLEVMLFTNARKISPELAKLFARVPPRIKIEITVYGMQAESYDAVACAPGAFSEFQRGIGFLQDYQVPFVVKSVLLPPNQNEREAFEAWANSIPWMDGGPDYAIFLELRARRDSLAKNQLIRRLRVTPEESVALIARDDRAFRRSMAQFSARFMGLQGDRLFACGAGETGCVDAYGVYQMCMPLRHPDTVYDLKQGTLRQALTEVFPHLRKLKATNPDYLKRCACCFLKGMCQQCPGKSWAEYGTLDTPVEYLCQVAHAQARYLGILDQSEMAWEVADWQTRVQKLSVKKNVS